MFKKKCPKCEKRIERKFNYCPWCAHSLKKNNEEEDFGMLGKNDMPEQNQMAPNLGLPLGLNNIFNGLVKQLEKELSGVDSQPSKGFKIKISTNVPQNVGVSFGDRPEENKVKTVAKEVSMEEKERRMKLKRVEAKSTLRRLPEGIVYEIETPGVLSTQDVVITKLEESIELKVYTPEKCFVKNIPLKVEVLGYSVKNDKVFLRLRG